MLETFRKHHYVLMCIIAVAVIISFTFFFNPNSNQGPQGGSSQRVGSVYGRDFTLGEVEIITGQQRIAGQLAQMAQDRSGEDPVSQFGQVIGDLVNTAETDAKHLDIDYPTNILVLRQECENVGIEVEREDIEKFIKQLKAFQTSGKFDAKKLEGLLTSGVHGDRPTTETKLFAALRDVMLFQRLAQTVGGSYAPSPAETDADYAKSNQQTTAAAVIVDKKAHETQTVTDEEIQKFYDAEKAKKEAVAKPDDKTPPESADPLVLSEEQRTVKYVITEAPKPPVAPTAPSPPPPPLPMEDVTALPEDQKKEKEEAYKKRQDEYKVQQEAYTKAMTAHGDAMNEHQKKLDENKAEKVAWLKKVGALCDAIVAEDRGGKTFDELAKILPPPAAVAAPVPVVPAPVIPAPVVPTPVAPEPTPSAPAPKAEDAPTKPAADPCQSSDEDKPAAEAAAPAPTPAADTAKPAEVTPAEALAVPPSVVVPAPAPAPVVAAPEPFGVKTVTFSASAPPEDLKKVTGRDGDAAKIIFGAKLFGPKPNDTEIWIEGEGQSSYCFFAVTGIQQSAVLPLDQVKTKISDKLKAEKVSKALLAAAEDARSNILGAIKEGKSFKDAAMEKAMLTATELPAFSKKTPLPQATVNGSLISSTITGEAGMGGPQQAGLQAGEMSQPLEVPEGLLLIYVEKKELPNHPEMEQQKKALAESHTYHDAAAKMPDFQGPGGFEGYMSAMQYFRGGYGTMTNPVLKAWFAARRADAQAVQ